MAIRLFFALVGVVALMWFFGWYGKATPAQRNDAIKKIMLYGFAGVLLLLVVTGRIHFVYAAVVALLPWIQRAMAAKRLWNMFKSFQGPTAGQTSRIQTQFLSMQLDHDSGDLSGEVLAGQFQGQQLDDLQLEQLLELLSECHSTDAQSASVLEAYLDRRFPDWRDDNEYAGTEQTNNNQTSDLTQTQAYEILGLQEGATREEIIDAHKSLMQKLHPDRGGSTFLASQVNRAKDILLDQLTG